jgi:hypothetical protein
MQRDGNVCIDFACLVADVEGDALTLSFDAPSHGTLTRTDDGRYLYRPASGFSGTDSFTYTVSDGQASAAATITLEVGQQGHCGNGVSIQVTSGWPSVSQTDVGYRYLVVNQGSGSNSLAVDAAAEDLPAVDWTGQPMVQAYAGASAGWAPLEEALVSVALAPPRGWEVKKPH